MFAKNCTGCTSVHNRNVKKARWNWDNCHAFKVSGDMYKICQTICKRSDNILRAIAITKHSEMTDANFSDLQSFVNRNSNATWKESGLALVECFKTTIHYYETIKSLTDSKGNSMVIDASNGKVPSADNFCQCFMQFYEDESAKAAGKQSLIFALMDVHLARLSGNTRVGFPTKVLNFFMAIHCLSPKASEMVTESLQGVSKRHIQRVSAKCRGPPVIHLTDKEIVLAVEKQIKMLRGRSGNESLRVAMSLDVNAIVILQAFQYLASHNAVIGGAYPNNWLEVGSTDKDDIQAVLK